MTDLGGEFPIALRWSISMLSVLLLVNDSELDDAGGSIDCDVVRSRFQERVVVTGREGREGKGKKYFEEEENVMRRRRGENTAKTYLKPLNRGANSR